MGRWLCGLVASTALVLGCASAAPPEQVQQSTVGDGGGGSDFAGQQCVDGADCVTGNPGTCDQGHVVCQGGVVNCVPVSTTQACYSGPAATRDIGACKSGTQTCIGSLGTCGGEVLPAAVENCFNDLDDDCDGKINNGCPDKLTTGTPRVLTAHGGNGGGAFTLRCPANSYVTKITVYGSSDTYIGGLDIVCGGPTLVRGTGSYTVTVAAVAATPNTQRGANVVTGAGNEFTYDCGAGFVPGWWFPGASDTGVDRVGLQCASTALSFSPTNQLTVAMTKQGTADSAGYNFGTLFEDTCNANEVLIGYDGRKGNHFDQLAAVCAPLVTTYIK